MYFFETKKENVSLAREEIESYTNNKIIKNKNIFSTTERIPFKRLALTNEVYKTCRKKKGDFKFAKIDKESLKFIKELKAQGNKVNLSNPKIIYKVINKKLCMLIWKNNNSYIKRNPKFRKGFHPAACSAKLARIMINLTGIKKGKILDPFCGTGGLLIEGSLMGIDMYGFDLDKKMLDATKLNLNQFNVKANLSQKNALDINKKFDAIATELPFGKTTKLDRKVSILLNDFLIVTKKITNKLVVVVPEDKYIIKDWRIKFKAKIYIHKSLSKVIYVLTNEN